MRDSYAPSYRTDGWRIPRGMSEPRTRLALVQAPAAVLLGKVVNLKNALTDGAGFKILGYCRFGKLVGILAEANACGQIL